MTIVPGPDCDAFGQPLRAYGWVEVSIGLYLGRIFSRAQPGVLAAVQAE